MTEDRNNGTPKDLSSRTFAVMLGELEDLATSLTNRQQELAKELATVDAELDRVEAVRSAMLGTSGRGRPARGSGATARRQTGTQERVARLRAHFGTREFTAADVADLLDVKVQGVGPVLAGIVRRGEGALRIDGEHRFYSFVEAAT